MSGCSRPVLSVRVCDALLDQDIFAGVGNIIKNEVLFFLEWKKQFVLKKHWLAHTKSVCPRCQLPFKKGKLGRAQRRGFTASIANGATNETQPMVVSQCLGCERALVHGAAAASLASSSNAISKRFMPVAAPGARMSPGGGIPL